MKRVAFLQELQMAAESVPVCALLVSGRRITSTFCARLRLPMANCRRLNNERKRQLTSLVFVHHCRIWSVGKLSRTPPLDLGDIFGSVKSKLCQRSACQHATHVQLTRRNNSSHVPQGFTQDFTKLVGRKQRRISFSPSDRSLALLLWAGKVPFPLFDTHLFVFYEYLGVHYTFLIAMVRYILDEVPATIYSHAKYTVIREPMHVFGLWEKPGSTHVVHFTLSTVIGYSAGQSFPVTSPALNQNDLKRCPTCQAFFAPEGGGLCTLPTCVGPVNQT